MRSAGLAAPRLAVALDALFFLVCLLLLSGCRAAPAGETDAAIDVVQRFFAALPDADCKRLGELLLPGRPCAEVVAEYNDHGVQLLAVESAVHHGREPAGILVRARLARGGEPQRPIAMLRVVRQDGAWRRKP